MSPSLSGMNDIKLGILKSLPTPKTPCLRKLLFSLRRQSLFSYRKKAKNIGIIFGSIRVFQTCLFIWLDGPGAFRITIGHFLNSRASQVLSSRFYLGFEWKARHPRHGNWVTILVLEGTLD